MKKGKFTAIIILILSTLMPVEHTMGNSTFQSEKTCNKSERNIDVRVLIQSGAEIVKVKAHNAIKIKGKNGYYSILYQEGKDTLTINAKDLKEELYLSDTNGETVSINGKLYRGTLRIIPRGESMEIVNILPLEDYLRGVLPLEISHKWPPETLKAQAVASRTFTIHNLKTNIKGDYDLQANILSQAYGGAGVEKETTDRAIKETEGMVVLHDNKIALTYFHAHSGGYTEDAKRVWSVDLPYLRSMPDKYTEIAPPMDWTYTLSEETIRDLLKKNGKLIGYIEAIIPEDIGPSGRARLIKIVHSEGETTISSNTFRLYLNPLLIKSTNFNVEKKDNNFTFKGKGFGHGVGMSQWGAYVMAKEGYSFTDILSFYYPGTEISCINETTIDYPSDDEHQ
ncbi:MAG: SpoIID/LytB domain-containing protein [Syntrophales bacterium]|nr:SpoIID/LytB domain-containing protein [Syntrophales bacterium]